MAKWLGFTSSPSRLLQVHVGLFFGTTMNGLVSDHRRGNAARVPYKLVISKLAPGAPPPAHPPPR